MRERMRPTRSGLFAIELVIAVGVFTLCAAVCTGIFAQSEVMSQDSEALSRAVNEARNAAECFKAAQGDLARTAELFGGEAVRVADGGETLLRMYGADWTETESPVEAAYQLFLTPEAADAGYIPARLQAVRADGKILLEWEIAALEAVT